MAEIIWTKKAFGLFQRIVKFIYEEEGLSYAEIARIKILQVTSLLGTNPEKMFTNRTWYLFQQRDPPLFRKKG